MSKKHKRDDWVSPSELGSYLYCSRQYWLSKVEGVKVDGATTGKLKAGVDNHHRHGIKYDWQIKFRRAATWLLFSGLAAALIYVYLQFRSTGGMP